MLQWIAETSSLGLCLPDGFGLWWLLYEHHKYHSCGTRNHHAVVIFENFVMISLFGTCLAKFSRLARSASMPIIEPRHGGNLSSKSLNAETPPPQKMRS